MGERYELFVAVLELVRVEALLPHFRGQVGRPEEDRAALARAFIAKAVFDIPTTRALIERLEVDGRLWRLCLERCRPASERGDVFAGLFEFAESRLASRLHETADCADDGWPSGGAHLSGCDGDRGAGEARAEGSEAEAAAQAGAAPQGRGAGEGAEPAGTATDDEPSADAGRPAEGLRCRRQAQRQGPCPPPGSSMDAPGDASSSLIGSVHAVRCCRLFGLLVRPVGRRWPVWRYAERVQIGYASLRAPIQELVFPIPSHLTVCPYLSSDLLASPTASRASPSQAMPGPGSSPSSSSAPR